MAIQKYNIIQPYDSNANELATRDAYTLFWNLTFDDQKNICSRPGHSLFLDLASDRPCYGYYWGAQKKLAVVTGSTLYLIDEYGASTSYAVTGLSSARACYFTDDGTRLFMAARGRIFQYTAGGSTVVPLSDPLAPTSTTTPIMFDGYLLANEGGTNRVQFGEYTDPEPYAGQPYEFAAANFFSAETTPAPVIALRAMWRQVVVFKEDAIEFWANDGATPFSRSGSVITNHGVLYPGAVVAAVDSIFAFTSRRKIVRLDNGQVTDITEGIAAELRALGTVDDVESSYVQTDSDEYVMFHFPTAGVSFVIDLKKNVWMKWGVWSSADVVFRANICASYVHAPHWNRWLGMSREGEILEVDESIATDNGTTIRSLLRSGFLDMDDPRRKFVVRDIIIARRGIGTFDPANPLNTNVPCRITYRYRNDSTMDWTDYILDLGKAGDYFQRIPCNRTGSFFQRQYEIEYTEPEPLTIRDFYTEIELAEV